ncbi:MAG: MoaD/ThiS family protein, partial [Terriglobales bacterium]
LRARAVVTVVLPYPLRTLAGIRGDAQLEVPPPVTAQRVLDALEARYPMLCGTVRDHATGQRRPYVRFYACGEDLSHASLDALLPEAVASGSEPFLIIAAIAGGAPASPLPGSRSPAGTRRSTSRSGPAILPYGRRGNSGPAAIGCYTGFGRGPRPLPVR